MRTSAGILVYRRRPHLQVLAGHPGGPFWAKRDAGAWSIVKGEIEPGEDAEAAARREFAEETGVAFEGPLVSLGAVTQKAGKEVLAYAGEMDVDVGTLRSNTLTIEWPPRSGREMAIPEIDRYEWFDVDDAKVALNSAQAELVDRLLAILAG